MKLDSEVWAELRNRMCDGIDSDIVGLISSLGELPEGTTIDGRVMTKTELAAANRRCPIYDTMPVWISSWADMWHRLGVKL